MEQAEDRPTLRERFAPPAARTIIRVLGATVRLRRAGFEAIDRLEAEGKGAVLAFFHGRQFLLAYALRGRNVAVMSSLSRDGELQARTLGGLGYRIVRGSSSRGGARAFIAISRLLEGGCHASFAVDGPRGPRHEVKPGAIHLAKRSGAAVVPMAASARPACVFERAWDRYMLPLPFCRGVALLGDPVRFDDDTSEKAMARDSEDLGRRLLALQEEADRMVGWEGGKQT